MTSLHDFLDEKEQVQDQSFVVDDENKIKNDIKILGDTTIIFLRRHSGETIETLVDTKSLDKISEIKNRWFANWDKHTQSFYVMASVKKNNGRQKGVLLHRHLTNCPNGLQVDHVNHDTLDNRIKNLRIVTLSQNLQNLKGAYKNNTSGIRGVDKKDGRWRARIQVNKKPIHLGYFDNEHEAEKAAIQARIKYFPHSKEAMEHEKSSRLFR